MTLVDGGRYKARACGQVVLGRSSEKGTPFIEFYFKITEGDDAGAEVRWTGYFAERSAARTIESLQYCGWEGEDLGEFADGELHGLDTNEVEIVVQLEEYEKDGEKRVTPRVSWVNRLGGGYLQIQNAMTADEAAAFGAKMKGLVLKSRQRRSPAQLREEADDFPFGANVEPPKSEPKATGTGGRRRF